MAEDGKATGACAGAIDAWDDRIGRHGTGLCRAPPSALGLVVVVVVVDWWWRWWGWVGAEAGAGSSRNLSRSPSRLAASARSVVSRGGGRGSECGGGQVSLTSAGASVY